MPPTITTFLQRSLRATAVIGLLLVIAAAPATAHVETGTEVDATTDDHGDTTVVFSFDHGCEESPTVGLRVQLPANATDPRPADPPGWSSTISEDVLTWTGPPIPDGTEGRFELVAHITGQAGDLVYFKTVQLCEEGENAWIEIPEAGGPEPESPAPSITLTQTVGDPEGQDASATSTPEAATPEPSLLTGEATSDEPAAGTEAGATGTIVLVAVMVVIAGGAIILYLRHRPTRPGQAGD